jgi:hypothetical protein
MEVINLKNLILLKNKQKIFQKDIILPDEVMLRKSAVTGVEFRSYEAYLLVHLQGSESIKLQFVDEHVNYEDIYEVYEKIVACLKPIE